MKGININPRDLSNNIDYDKSTEMDRAIKQKIREDYESKGLWLTDEYMVKQKYPLEMCSICGQKGCDMKATYKELVNYYHKRCFKLFKKEAVNFAIKQFKKKK